MRVSADEIAGLRAYMRASRELTGWIAGARALALLGSAVESGLLEALGAKRSVEELASVTGLDAEAVLDLCLALQAHDVVVRDGDRFELAPRYALLASPSAAVPLPIVIRQSMVAVRRLLEVGSHPAHTAIPGADVLAVADGAGISAMSSSVHVAPVTIGAALPEVDAALRAGAHHLEVGCGVGNALLGIVSTYPQVSAVGLEIDEPTAAEALRRANALGIADRVEVRHADACDMTDEAAFDTVQWSQFFFPVQSRGVVLEAIRRALKPGGYLFMPWLGSVSDDTASRRGAKLRAALRSLRSGVTLPLLLLNDVLGDTPSRRKAERRQSSLQRLIFHGWGVPVHGLDELAAEIRDAGFVVLRTTPMPVSQFALTRGFLLARRPAASP